MIPEPQRTYVLELLNALGPVAVGAKLKELGYSVVDGAWNFQFEKSIPGTNEMMRIEFMAPEEFKRERDIRLDVEKGRSCASLHGRQYCDC